MAYTVVDTKDVQVGQQCPTLGIFPYESEAADFISTLPEAESGRYSIDGPTILHINNRAQLVELAKLLKVRPDWHEPDELDVTAKVFGESFDNAGFWGTINAGSEYTGPYTPAAEMFVQIRVEDQAVAEVNLATLFAFACGTFEG